MKDCYHNEEYSMVLRMIISEKWIHINSYDVCFDYNVKSVIILKQKIIVQLEIGDLYAVDMVGNIIEKNNKPFQRSDLDKDFIVEINQNNLYFNNSAVYFEHNIYSFVLFDDRIIVQLNELMKSTTYMLLIWKEILSGEFRIKKGYVRNISLFRRM